LRHEKDTGHELHLKTDSDEGILTVTKTLTPTAEVTKTLLLQAVQVRAKSMFGQDHRTLGILVMSIPSLEAPVE